MDEVERNIVICRALADQLFADAEGRLIDNYTKLRTMLNAY
jgi:hypothetical protein